jgi:PEGA domain-containing protein
MRGTLRRRRFTLAERDRAIFVQRRTIPVVAMRTFASHALSLAALLAFSPPAAAAESVGVVAVAEPPGPSPELAELTHQLRSVVAEKTPGVLEDSELRERMTGQTSSATLSELDRAYAGALATYQNGDFEGAVRTLRAVVQDLDRLPPSAEMFSQWTRAMLRLARSEQTLGRGGEAKEVLQRLVRANPAVKVDPNQYPPSFVKQVDDVRKEIGALKKHKLAVNATAKGAKVFVEGREVGSAPLTVELPPGRYRISGAVGNLRVPGVPVDLTEEGQAVVLNFALAESLRPAVGPGLALAETDRAKNLVAAGAWLGVDKLLVSRLVTEGGVEYLAGAMYDVRRGILQREGRVRLANKVAPPGGLSALASFLITGQASQLVAATPVPLPPPPAGKPSLEVKPPKPTGASSEVDLRASAGPSRAKTMGWTAFGAGIASVGLGGLAIFEGLQANSNYSKAKKLTQNGILLRTASPDQYDSYVSKGNSAKTIGFVSGGAAVGLAVGAGVLGYLSYKQTGEVGPFRF